MRTFYSFLFVLLSNTLFGQNYLPIPESNAVWIEASFMIMAYNNHEHATSTQSLSFGADSVVNGTTYHSLHGPAIVDWIDGWGNPQNYQSGSDTLIDEIRVLFRQDIPNKRVYQWDKGTNQEQILYDFQNLVVGQPYPQTLNNVHYPQILVMAYDSVLLADGLYHDKWVLGSNSNDSGFVSIIEGVGSTMGFDLPISIPFEQSSATLCLSADSTMVYDGWSNANGLIQPRYSENCEADLGFEEKEMHEIGLELFPNPIVDLLSIRCSEPIQKVEIFTLLGHLISAHSIPNSRTFNLNLESLPSGNYLVKIFTINDQVEIQSLVK